MTNNTNLLNIFNHFVGYGALDSEFIYFGIEEHGGNVQQGECENLRYEAYLEKYEATKGKDFFIMDDNDFNSFYEKFADKNQRQNDLDNSLKSVFYKFCCLINKHYKNQKSLICNLYPLWKNSTSKPDYDKKTQSDFGVNNFGEWYTKYYRVREEVIKSFFNFLISTEKRYNIFTFGESHSFINLFNNILQDGIVNIELPEMFSCAGRNRKYWKFNYKNLKVHIFYHPSHKWINENQLNEILLNI